MIVVSVFDGMSNGQIALGDKVTKYYASEIEPKAIKVTQANFPKTTQLGSITGWRTWDIDWATVDLLIGGSPCQGFSLSGLQLNFDDERSALFFEYLDLLNHIRSFNPKVQFLLENVFMAEDLRDAISCLVGVQPIYINSAMTSPHSRQRYYWCSWSTSQPDNTYTKLIDYIESGVVDRVKAHCFDANYGKNIPVSTYFAKSRRQLIFEEIQLGCLGKPRNAMKHYNGNLETIIPKLTEGLHYRKRLATPREVEGIFGIPLGYTRFVDTTARYHMLGNGWDVRTLKHLFGAMI